MRRLDEEDTGLPFLGAVRYPRPAPQLRVWPGWMTGTELRRFAPRRVTVHASPPRRTAYCVPHSDRTSAGGSKARATPGISSDGNLTLGQFSGSLERRAPLASKRRLEENDPNLLPRNRLGRLIDCFIEEDGDNRISTRHRMIGEKDDGLATGRNLDGAAHHTLAGQLLAHSGGVAL